jgi:AraC family transcriptional regulator, regulatory protein of adaptative response / methylated-DNA-[protein]-cysteine methyltransferase
MQSLNLGFDQLSADYRRIERAIHYLEQHVTEQPSLKEMADSVNLSEYHFQRLFSRWVGISPKRFMQYLTKERAKALLLDSRDLLETSLVSGLSGPGRLHDLFVTSEAVTPGEFKRRGQGLEIRYGFHPTPFGECLLALTGRGVSNLIFVLDDDREKSLAELRGYWPEANLREDPVSTGPIVEALFDRILKGEASPLNLYLNGTNFQLKVWEALLRIPAGTVVSYEDVAVSIGMPGASRAVGNAVNRNPIPVIVPCHRVIRKSGDLSNYRWGSSRKKALLGWEAAALERGFVTHGIVSAVAGHG